VDRIRDQNPTWRDLFEKAGLSVSSEDSQASRRASGAGQNRRSMAAAGERGK
jgi:hypothetical protein